MRSLTTALSLILAGAFAGGFSVHTAYTAPAVSYIEPQGARLYNDAERRDLKRLIRSELLRAKQAGKRQA